MGLREDILGQRGAAGLKREEVEFCGRKVWAWELTGDQCALVEEARRKIDAKKGTVQVTMRNERAIVIFYGIRDSGDDNAKKVFRVGDEVYLNKLGASALHVPYEKIIDLSGMNPMADEDTKKNSETTPSDEDSIDSPNGEDGLLSLGDSGELARAN